MRSQQTSTGMSRLPGLASKMRQSLVSDLGLENIPHQARRSMKPGKQVHPSLFARSPHPDKRRLNSGIIKSPAKNRKLQIKLAKLGIQEKSRVEVRRRREEPVDFHILCKGAGERVVQRLALGFLCNLQKSQLLHTASAPTNTVGCHCGRRRFVPLPHGLNPGRPALGNCSSDAFRSAGNKGRLQRGTVEPSPRQLQRVIE